VLSFVVCDDKDYFDATPRLRGRLRFNIPIRSVTMTTETSTNTCA